MTIEPEPDDPIPSDIAGITAMFEDFRDDENRTAYMKGVAWLRLRTLGNFWAACGCGSLDEFLFVHLGTDRDYLDELAELVTVFDTDDFENIGPGILGDLLHVVRHHVPETAVETTKKACAALVVAFVDGGDLEVLARIAATFGDGNMTLGELKPGETFH